MPRPGVSADAMADPRRAYSHPGLGKAAFLADLAMHRDADRLVQGFYATNGKFCAVGCAIETVRQRFGDTTIAYDDHGAYERYLGIPRILAWLEDGIFEELPIEEAREWPLRFSAAIPEGADLTAVWSNLAPRILRELVLPAAMGDERCAAAVRRVIAGYESAWANDSPVAASDAAAAAYAATVATVATAYAATVATASARYAAAARYAADAARSAEAYAAADAAFAVYAAEAYGVVYAAEACDAAARRNAWRRTAAARRDAWRRIAAILCELLAEAPIRAAVSC